MGNDDSKSQREPRGDMGGGWAAGTERRRLPMCWPRRAAVSAAGARRHKGRESRRWGRWLASIYQSRNW